MTSRFPNKRSPLIRFAEPIMPGCMSTPLLREWPYYPKTDQSMYGMVSRSWKWPPPSSAVSDEQENAFVKRCFPKPRAEFGRRAMDLNHEKYSSICNLADNVGLTHIQGMSLRRQVMRHANAYSGQPINDNQMFGFDDDMKLIKDAAFKFEECVSDFFIAEHKFQRIKRAYDPHVDRFPAFSTEDDLKAMQKSGAMGDCKITPDLLFHTPGMHLSLCVYVMCCVWCREACESMCVCIYLFSCCLRQSTSTVARSTGSTARAITGSAGTNSTNA
jgi:hypothetical protein